jgi:hypothetical protein
MLDYYYMACLIPVGLSKGLSNGLFNGMVL